MGYKVEDVRVNVDGAEVGDIVVDETGDMYIIVKGSEAVDFTYALICITYNVELFLATDYEIDDLLEMTKPYFIISEIIPHEKISIVIS